MPSEGLGTVNRHLLGGLGTKKCVLAKGGRLRYHTGEGASPPDRRDPMQIKRTAPTGAEGVERLGHALQEAQAVVIGAGAGLSAAAGFAYAGARFDRYFQDFGQSYGFQDMYTGGFYPFPDPQTYWAYWSRMIWLNRYQAPPRPVYRQLMELVEGKDYFVLTTNVDHCFQRAGVDRARLFYTQGDYGLFQCARPCHPGTYDNQTQVRAMVEAQGFSIGPDGGLALPVGRAPSMTVPKELLPRCPKCGGPMAMNLRVDGSFVEDRGWRQAAERYSRFLRRNQGRAVLFWELGVGYNTPGIIKYPFWRMAEANPQAAYACVNAQSQPLPQALEGRAIRLQGDIEEILTKLERWREGGGAA